MASIFNNEIIPRKLTLKEQNELAIKYAKCEFVNVLIKQELDYKEKYKKAMFIGAKEEAEDWKVMLFIMNKALRLTIN